MIPVWPTGLPKPQRTSYQSQYQDPRLRRRAETGPSGMSLRYSSAARIVSLSMGVSRDQKAIFDRFFENDVSMGSLPFLMPDPLTDGWPLLAPDGEPMLSPDGERLLIAAYWLCQFGETMPVETIRGIRFQISFPVVVMP